MGSMRLRVAATTALLAAGGEEPGTAAAILRKSVALEVRFALVVIAVTSVLVVTEPANPDRCTT
jgi:hypothetical protein